MRTRTSSCLPRCTLTICVPVDGPDVFVPLIPANHCIGSVVQILWVPVGLDRETVTCLTRHIGWRGTERCPRALLCARWEVNDPFEERADMNTLSNTVAISPWTLLHGYRISTVGCLRVQDSETISSCKGKAVSQGYAFSLRPEP